MPEMDARFQQILQLRLRHARPFVGSSATAFLSRSHPPDGRTPRTGSGSVIDAESSGGTRPPARPPPPRPRPARLPNTAPLPPPPPPPLFRSPSPTHRRPPAH